MRMNSPPQHTGWHGNFLSIIIQEEWTGTTFNGLTLMRFLSERVRCGSLVQDFTAG